MIDALTERTRAVFMTHVQGFDGLTDDLLTRLRSANVPLIEDVCESHGATHNRKKLGTFGWISNFSYYYAHHMTTIEGGMICTDDPEVYQAARMLRSHGMVRESNDPSIKDAYVKNFPDLNPDFIFAHAAYNVRNTEIGGILGRKQLRRWTTMSISAPSTSCASCRGSTRRNFVQISRRRGLATMPSTWSCGSPDMDFVERLMSALRKGGVEFRRGSAGGGNQLRQPYLRSVVPPEHYKKYPEADHIHFFGFYIGNFPDLNSAEVDEICELINSVN